MAVVNPQPGPSNENEDENFSRPQDPPVDSDLYYMPATPNYSPSGHTPGYSGYTPGHSGITPGYSGPSPEQNYGAGSPVYSGPEPGALSNASTPGRGTQEDNLGYTPSYSGYTPSNPGTPQQYSPGNATPARTPSHSSPSGTGGSTGALTGNFPSPQIQQPEVTGNTTPHPGPSEESRNPKYFW